MAAPAIGIPQIWGITRKSPFFIIGLILAFFFLINGSALFGETWEGWDKWVMVYVMMMVTSFALSRELIERATVQETLLWFAIGFGAGTALFMMVFRNLEIPQPFPVGELWAIVLFQGMVVTYAEEGFFRRLLTSKIGIIPSAGAFALFHYAAYSSQIGFSPWFLVQPFIFGLAFAFLYLKTRERAGIGLVWGLHLSYNLTVLGISFF